MRYFVDVAGRYLGGWDKNPPNGAIEVPSAPSDARQPWLGGQWGEIPHDKDKSKTPVDKLRDFLNANPDVKSLLSI